MERKLRKDSDYLQPDFYHFSQDSVLLAEIVANESISLPEGSWCMDIGAGCGIVGFEVIKRLKHKVNFDFLEIQKDFVPFFNENLKVLGSKRGHCQFHHIDFRKFLVNRKYSLVVSNPPYFIPGKGRPASNPKKNKCRFFLDGSYCELLLFFKKVLSPMGKGFFLLRNDEKIFEELLIEFGDFFKFEKRAVDQKTNLIVLSILDIEGN